jgi:squalene-hopene/tetraprenyl-beta-curcumene cyclase
VREAAALGVKWLLDLQNRDGGIPTFCRGWTNLPFDKSSSDITAHAVRAWLAWYDDADHLRKSRTLVSLKKTLNYLCRVYATTGTGFWNPLWFGNQHQEGEHNPLYGTAKVLIALNDALEFGIRINVQGPTRKAFLSAWKVEAHAGLCMVCSQYGPSDGWKYRATGPTSIEESALAVEALAALAGRTAAKSANNDRAGWSAFSGSEWLIERVEDGTWTRPAPIGFYFAKLWYYEKLYPMIFTVGALSKAKALLDARSRGATS